MLIMFLDLFLRSGIGEKEAGEESEGSGEGGKGSMGRAREPEEQEGGKNRNIFAVINF